MNFDSMSNEELMDLYKETRKQVSVLDTKQMALKIALNSCYGAVGNQYFRFYDIRNAEAITLSGQLSIRWIEKAINEHLNKLFKTENKDYVIAVDTDSTYLNLENVVNHVFKDKNTEKNKIVNFLDKFCKEILQPYIDKKYNELAEYMNSYEQCMDMKREVIADKGIWVAKKRYCLNIYDSEGVRYKHPKLKVMGIEVKRSSTPKVVRDKLEKCLNIILNENEDNLIEYVQNFKKEFKNLSPEEVAFPRGVNGMDIYYDEKNIYKKSTPIAVKGALIFNDYIRKNKLTHLYNIIGNGDKIKFVYLKEQNPTVDKVISFTNKYPVELGKKYVDYDMQFEKSFIDPLSNILNAIGWSYEHKSSLIDFF